MPNMDLEAKHEESVNESCKELTKEERKHEKKNGEGKREKWRFQKELLP